MSSSQRPAKRQRRSTKVLSDDDDDAPAPKTFPVRQTNKTNGAGGTGKPTSRLRQATSKPSSARSSPQTSPEKTRNSRKFSLEETKNKSINSFFGKATEEQRWRKKSSTPEMLTENLKLADDIMDDEIFDDDLAELVSHIEEPAANKNATLTQRHSNAVSSSMPPPSSGQRFRKASGPPAVLNSLVSSTTEEERDYKPWADRYGPDNLEELAVHKKKVQDVQKWLLDAVPGRSPQRLLVLKGPAGTGKSSTVRALAKLLKLGLVSWQNPNVTEVGAMSAMVQFADFVNRGAGYATLGLDTNESRTSSAPTEQVALLVEEFPASAMRYGGGLDVFRNVLQNYLAASQSRNSFGTNTVPSHAPIILVISETLVSSSTALTDSFTAHRLLGPELTHNAGVAIIEFNPVAPTFIAKALELVIRKEARDSGRRRIPGPAVLQKLAEVGDIRSAVNSLEFLCSRNDDAAGWSGTVAANSKRGSKVSQPLSEMEQNSIKLISQRESTLDMFHAAGKVAYNKREDPAISNSDSAPNPPSYLTQFQRPKVSQVDIESLLNETGTDIQTFISTLHENYVLSCNHEDFVDYFEACSAYLSDSELLNPDTRRLARGRGAARTVQINIQSDTTDALRQDEIGFQLATRGLLFSLPFPVSRAAPPGGRKADSFKMFYPAGLRIWKPTEEIRDLIELQASRLLDGTFYGTNSTKPRGGIESWNSRMFDRVLPADDEDSENTRRIDTNRDNLVLEILPYLSQIRQARQEDVTILNKITKPRGLHVSNEEPFAEETEEIGSISSNLRQKVEAAHSTLTRRQASGESSSPRKNNSLQGQSSKEEPAIQTLYIEDDDIIDSD